MKTHFSSAHPKNIMSVCWVQSWKYSNGYSVPWATVAPRCTLGFPKVLQEEEVGELAISQPSLLIPWRSCLDTLWLEGRNWVYPVHSWVVSPVQLHNRHWINSSWNVWRVQWKIWKQNLTMEEEHCTVNSLGFLIPEGWAAHLLFRWARFLEGNPLPNEKEIYVC